MGLEHALQSVYLFGGVAFLNRLLACRQVFRFGEHLKEFLDFAGAILMKPAEIIDGAVTARDPGLGIEWNESAVAKYLVT